MEYDKTKLLRFATTWVTDSLIDKIMRQTPMSDPITCYLNDSS